MKHTIPLLLAALALPLLAGCGRSIPLPRNASSSGTQKRDSLTGTGAAEPNGSCAFAAAAVQSGNGAYRPCTEEPGSRSSCIFRPYNGEYVQLAVYSRDGGNVTVDYGQAFNGSQGTFANGQSLPPLNLSDGSDGRFNCDTAEVIGLDASGNVGCKVTLVRLGNFYGFYGCTQKKK